MLRTTILKSPKNAQWNKPFSVFSEKPHFPGFKSISADYSEVDEFEGRKKKKTSDFI